MDFDSEHPCFIAGFSMFPLLQNGDRVRPEPVRRDDLRPGDVVAFRSADGVSVVHRVMRTMPELLTRGDNNPRYDPPVPTDSPLGLVKAAERNGKTFPLTGGAAGLRVFQRNQFRRRMHSALIHLGRTVCRLSPWKVREEQLEQAHFGGETVYYHHGRPIGTRWNGQWLWLYWPAVFFIKQPRSGRHSVFLRLIGAVAAGRGKEYYQSLSPVLRESCCEQGRRLGFSALFYHELSDTLSHARRQQFQADYYAQVTWEISYRRCLDDCRRLFSELQIPFLCMKGASFAYRIYPAPQTRFRRDLDLLFRKEQVETVYHKLIEAGWTPRERDVQRNRSLFYRQHLPPLSRKGSPSLELHWHIFKDVSLDPARLWDYAHPDGDGTEYGFAPEVHYLLLAYNMYLDSWEFAARSLLDMALLQKRFTLDKALIERLNRDWNLNLDLGLPYAVFPECFTDDMKIFTSPVPAETAAAIRTLANIEQSGQVRHWLAQGFDLPERQPGIGQRIHSALETFRSLPSRLHKSGLKRNRIAYRNFRFLEKNLPRFHAIRAEARASHIRQNAG